MAEPALWPLLREIGPEFFEVAVRAQVAWHGPTAAWAIAMELRVRTDEVDVALRRLSRAGEIHDARLLRAQAQLDTSARDRRWVLSISNAGPVDLWAFTLAWLARRSFGELHGQARLAERRGVELELAVAELIDRAESDGATVAGGVRDELAVLGDRLQASGDPWGLWIAALLSGSVVARQEHEAALAKAVKAKMFEESALGRDIMEATAGGLSGPAPFSPAPPLFGHMQAGLGSAVDAMQEFNRAMAALGPVVEDLCGTLGEVAGVLDQDEAPPKEGSGPSETSSGDGSVGVGDDVKKRQRVENHEVISSG